ncbi:MAG: tetratricopeptide repeat protein [Deltaproteobacteria bacterium]|nr:tetratricopeptide repeat protein [Deltaproteobacteria bacterium]
MRWLLVLCLVFVGTTRAHADDPSLRAAKRHFDRGEKLFALGKFEEALEHYQKAYDAKPLPAFLFNIGQCHRNLNDYDAAIFSFRKYLKLEPDASNRDKVEALIEDLEQKKAEEESRKLRLVKPPRSPGEDPVTVDPPAGRPFYKKWWFWTGLAVVAGGVGVGVYASSPKGPPGTDLGHMVFDK